MSNIYHIIERIPFLTTEGMYVEYEELAQTLAASGLMRVDTNGKCNFARLVDPSKNVSLMISKQQLAGELLEATKARLMKVYNNSVKVASLISNCNSQIAKHIEVEPELILKLARLLVQSTHSIVMHWILLEKVEVFVSYSYNIGDMMDVQTWQHSGTNSGMQSTDGKSVAVYTSCDGNPFAETDPKVRIHGDGWPAVARMQIVVAQELGHFSDIKRDYSGRQIGRHSANFSCTRAAPHVKSGRVDDITKCNEILADLMNNGMNTLIEHETALKFYRKNKLHGLKNLYHMLMIYFYEHKLVKLASSQELLFVKRFKQEQYMGLMINAMIDDMKFNLEPVADVYKRADKEAEIAIACVEALARVPQQCIKWGHITTSVMMGSLYHIYYNEVIPDLIDIYGNLTGKPYTPNLNKIPVKITTRIKRFFKCIFGKRNKPYRELD